MSTELVVNNVNDIVMHQEQTFNSVCVDDKINFAKESQFAMQLMQGNKYLNDTAWNNKSSLQNAIINVASIGITLNPAKKFAYLVPRKSAVCLDISYLGLIYLAQSVGSIAWAQCKLVRANDTYQNMGLDKAPAHQYNAFASNDQRGEVVGGYCTVKLPSGDFMTHEMNLEAIKAIQKLSPSGSKGPWKDHWDEMARKTIVKQSAKYWPSVDRLENAIEMINVEGGEGLDFKKEKDVTPKAIENAIETLKEMVKGKPMDKVLAWLEVEKIEDVTKERAEWAVRSLRNAQ